MFKKVLFRLGVFLSFFSFVLVTSVLFVLFFREYTTLNSIAKYRTARKKEFAFKLRINPTLAEITLMKALGYRNRIKNRIRFKFQYIICGYIVDIYHPITKTAIEIDGPYHNDPDQKYKDKYRTSVLNKEGIFVLRFTNWKVMNDIENVLIGIYKTIENRWSYYNKPDWLKEYRNKKKVVNDVYIPEKKESKIEVEAKNEILNKMPPSIIFRPGNSKRKKVKLLMKGIDYVLRPRH